MQESTAVKEAMLERFRDEDSSDYKRGGEFISPCERRARVLKTSGRPFL